MIAIAKSSVPADAVQDPFLKMLPAIQQQASHACRTQDAEARDEFVQEVVANAYLAFLRLVERGKEHLAYATPLARYAIRQIRTGRRVGARLNVRDVSSLHARLTKRITVERLDRCDRDTGEWQEILVEDQHAGPAETAAARVDLAAWLRALSRTKRRVAKKLAKGETTGEVARMFNLSAGRVSQLRRELEASWLAFQGEPVAA